MDDGAQIGPSTGKNTTAIRPSRTISKPKSVELPRTDSSLSSPLSSPESARWHVVPPSTASTLRPPLGTTIGSDVSRSGICEEQQSQKAGRNAQTLFRHSSVVAKPDAASVALTALASGWESKEEEQTPIRAAFQSSRMKASVFLPMKSKSASFQADGAPEKDKPKRNSSLMKTTNHAVAVAYSELFLQKTKMAAVQEDEEEDHTTSHPRRNFDHGTRKYADLRVGDVIHLVSFKCVHTIMYHNSVKFHDEAAEVHDFPKPGDIVNPFEVLVSEDGCRWLFFHLGSLGEKFLPVANGLEVYFEEMEPSPKARILTLPKDDHHYGSYHSRRKYRLVSHDDVPIRRGPSLDAQVVGTLEKGRLLSESVCAVREESGWLKLAPSMYGFVKTSPGFKPHDPKKEGWCSMFDDLTLGQRDNAKKSLFEAVENRYDIELLVSDNATGGGDSGRLLPGGNVLLDVEVHPSNKVRPPLLMRGFPLSEADIQGKLLWATVQAKNTLAISSFASCQDLGTLFLQRHGVEKVTFFHEAATIEVVDALLELLVDHKELRAASLEVKDRLGQTALHYAAKTGNVDVLKALLKVDASVVWIKDTDGHTALDLAGGKIGVVDALVHASRHSSRLLYDVKNFMLLTSVEEKELANTSEFLSPNPRKIKRIMNVLAIVRQLASPLPAFRQHLVRWVVMCEQWPLSVSVILHSIGDDFQANNGNIFQYKDTMPLFELYDKVKWLVHDLAHRIENEAEDLRRRHQKIVSLDDDVVLFERLLRVEPILTVGDVGNRLRRSDSRLSSFVNNLNPAMRSSLAQMLTSHIGAEELSRRQAVNYRPLILPADLGRSFGGSGTSFSSSAYGGGGGSIVTRIQQQQESGPSRSSNTPRQRLAPVPPLSMRKVTQFSLGQRVEHVRSGDCYVVVCHGDGTYSDSDRNKREPESNYRAYWTGSRSTSGKVARYYEGQEVEAVLNRSKLGMNNWHPGVITKVDLESNTYNVEFRSDRRVIEIENGIDEKYVRIDFEKKFEYEEGQKVVLKSSDATCILVDMYGDVAPIAASTASSSAFLEGEVTNRHSDRTYDVTLDDNRVLTYVPKKLLHRAGNWEAELGDIAASSTLTKGPRFSPGDLVDVLLESTGACVWRSGTIAMLLKPEGDKSLLNYVVSFDDTGEECDATEEDIWHRFAAISGWHQDHDSDQHAHQTQLPEKLTSSHNKSDPTPHSSHRHLPPSPNHHHGKVSSKKIAASSKTLHFRDSAVFVPLPQGRCARAGHRIGDSVFIAPADGKLHFKRMAKARIKSINHVERTYTVSGVDRPLSEQEIWWSTAAGHLIHFQMGQRVHVLGELNAGGFIGASTVVGHHRRNLHFVFAEKDVTSTVFEEKAKCAKFRTGGRDTAMLITNKAGFEVRASYRIGEEVEVCRSATSPFEQGVISWVAKEADSITGRPQYSCELGTEEILESVPETLIRKRVRAGDDDWRRCAYAVGQRVVVSYFDGVDVDEVKREHFIDDTFDNLGRGSVAVKLTVGEVSSSEGLSALLKNPIWNVLVSTTSDEDAINALVSVLVWQAADANDFENVAKWVALIHDEDATTADAHRGGNSNSDNATALHRMVFYNNVGGVAALLGRGASAKVKNRAGKSPKDLATSSEAILNMLLAAPPARPSERNENKAKEKGTAAAPATGVRRGRLASAEVPVRLGVTRRAARADLLANMRRELRSLFRRALSSKIRVSPVRGVVKWITDDGSYFIEPEPGWEKYKVLRTVPAFSGPGGGSGGGGGGGSGGDCGGSARKEKNNSAAADNDKVEFLLLKGSLVWARGQHYHSDGSVWLELATPEGTSCWVCSQELGDPEKGRQEQEEQEASFREGKALNTTTAASPESTFWGSTFEGTWEGLLLSVFVESKRRVVMSITDSQGGGTVALGADITASSDTEEIEKSSKRRTTQPPLSPHTSSSLISIQWVSDFSSDDQVKASRLPLGVCRARLEGRMLCFYDEHRVSLLSPTTATPTTPTTAAGVDAAAESPTGLQLSKKKKPPPRLVANLRILKVGAPLVVRDESRMQLLISSDTSRRPSSSSSTTTPLSQEQKAGSGGRGIGSSSGSGGNRGVSSAASHHPAPFSPGQLVLFQRESLAIKHCAEGHRLNPFGGDTSALCKRCDVAKRSVFKQCESCSFEVCADCTEGRFLCHVTRIHYDDGESANNNQPGGGGGRDRNNSSPSSPLSPPSILLDLKMKGSSRKHTFTRQPPSLCSKSTDEEHKAGFCVVRKELGSGGHDDSDQGLGSQREHTKADVGIVVAVHETLAVVLWNHFAGGATTTATTTSFSSFKYNNKTKAAAAAKLEVCGMRHLERTGEWWGRKDEDDEDAETVRALMSKTNPNKSLLSPNQSYQSSYESYSAGSVRFAGDDGGGSGLGRRQHQRFFKGQNVLAYWSKLFFPLVLEDASVSEEDGVWRYKVKGDAVNYTERGLQASHHQAQDAQTTFYPAGTKVQVCQPDVAFSYEFDPLLLNDWSAKGVVESSAANPGFFRVRLLSSAERGESGGSGVGGGGGNENGGGGGGSGGGGSGGPGGGALKTLCARQLRPDPMPTPRFVVGQKVEAMPHGGSGFHTARVVHVRDYDDNSYDVSFTERDARAGTGSKFKVKNPWEVVGLPESHLREAVSEGAEAEAGGALKDDKTGKDHVNTSLYALRLCQYLFQKGMACPMTIGLYASWGSGKSFMMHKVEMATKVLWLCSQIDAAAKLLEHTTDAAATAAAANAGGGHSNRRRETKKREESSSSASTAQARLLLRESTSRAETRLHALFEEGQTDHLNDLFQWVSLGCPQAALQSGGGSGSSGVLWSLARNLCCCGRGGGGEAAAASQVWPLKSGTIQKRWGERCDPFRWEKELWQLLVWPVVLLFQGLKGIAERKLPACKGTGIGHGKFSSGDEHLVDVLAAANEMVLQNVYAEGTAAVNASLEIPVHDYVFCSFNAWLYSGSDNQWAGSLQSIHEAVDLHLGPTYAHAQRRSQFVTLLMKTLAFAGACFLLWSLSTNSSAHVLVATKNKALDAAPFDAKLVVSAVVALGTFALASSAGIKYLLSPASKAERVAQTMGKPNFKERLGYMNEVKAELQEIGDWVEGKREPPSCWTLLTPLWLRSALGALAEVSAELGLSLKPRKGHRRSARLMLFVDDLDRCHPTKIVEVLQSVVLLTEGTPFVVFLAVDPRVIVSAVESVDSHFFGEAGINGYEYLDKIVQVPFALNELTVDEVQKMLKGYLAGGLLEGQAPELSQVLDTIVKAVPRQVDDNPFSGPLLLKFKGSSKTVHARVRCRQLDALTGAGGGGGGGGFVLEPSNPKGKSSLGTFSAGAVLLARWFYFRVESLSSAELLKIKTLLRDFQLMGEDINLEEILFSNDILSPVLSSPKSRRLGHGKSSPDRTANGLLTPDVAGATGGGSAGEGGVGNLESRMLPRKTLEFDFLLNILQEEHEN